MEVRIWCARLRESPGGVAWAEPRLSFTHRGFAYSLRAAMSRTPQELRDFLAAPSPAAGDEAWARFIQRFSPLLLHTARVVTRDHDRAMDAYTLVLGQLREDAGKRLRQYAEDPRSQFSTWLVVVTRRLCLDYLRQRYGRLRGDSVQESAEYAGRRRLVDLVAEEIGEDTVLPDSGLAPDDHLRRQELTSALQVSLARLSPAQRLLLAMRFEDGRSAREIAAALQYRTPFHVYRALTSVLSQLRQSLADVGVCDPEP